MSLPPPVAVPWSSITEASNQVGVIFYGLPQDIVPEQIDPLLRRAVFQINASGWVWTAESCQGHPDAASLSDTAWEHNVEPFIRFVCREHDLDRLTGELTRAARIPPDDETAFHAHQLRLIPSGQPEKAGWAELLVYVKAHNVMTRDAGVRMFERFAEAIQ